ncbi:NAD(P)-dependent dehydrogenase (short-subunit alcohol dehydrogenase family) [Paenibacillus cellulosilyticus]|uniref:NAD(P)-dependent dehydrogenase (Short-subunit alcohol dehydrogenase family) n=1 Tax=Paenibacillus cellulosilyticus TaxID=375489 RepID=A0A2V2YZJ2_9BACL|nr:SDR family oxidoreductase [Paenibacillus cellulosilyticus]PWV99334.1 NAD(P)-dependent dehydrogenase (short-subunit alcohol dehydrogenase family) [Paenibacillus cellulosilyticus]QKS45099.1 SDR family oxidoreductase [Paenibacillus cellulosilyticus]
MPRKVVFIADADSWSGEGLIARFGQGGWDLILNSTQDDNEWEDVILFCKVAGAKVLITHADLCSSRDLTTMLDQAEEQLGTVDVLIHNCCLIKPTDVEHCDETDFVEIMQRNAKSAFFCTQTFGRRMAARGSGSVIFVSSVHNEKPTGSSFAYSASQGAVKMLAHEAALFLGRSGIRVNLIEMGPIEGSDVSFQSDISGLYNDYRYKIPSTKLGTANDLANLAFFLAGEESGYLNGSDIRLDGGFLLHYMDHRMNKPAEGETRTQ